MRIVDDAVLAVLREVLPDVSTGTRVHDGEVRANNTTKVVTYPLPYVVYTSNFGADETRRLAGAKSRRSVFFSCMFVGESREQVKWAQGRVRDRIADKRLQIPDHKTWPVELMASQRIRRDDDAIRPDGSPLFYGVDEYDLAITLYTTEAGAP